MIQEQDLRILVVDDVESARSVIIRLLRKIGYDKIEEACDGAEALQRIQDQSYQLIISDWDMPNMTGLELLRHLRKTPEFSDIPFVLIAASAKKDQVLAAVKEKVSQYLLKPFTQLTLQEAIDNVIRQKAVRLIKQTSTPKQEL